MSAPPVETVEVARAAVAQLHEAIDVLQGLDVSGSGDGVELLALWGEHERARRRLASTDQQFVAAAEGSGIAWDKGYKDTAGLVRELLRVSPREAKARVKAAADAGPRRSLVGEPLGPIYATVAVAQQAGVISEQHARLITRTVDRLPDAVQAVHGPWLEEFLVDNAGQFDPQVLGRLAVRAVDTLDPDGVLRDHAYRERTREFGLVRRADGSATPTGSFTAELTEYLLVVEDALGGPQPAEDGTRDPRTSAQRRHDALLGALKIAISSGLVPKAGGITSTLVLTMSDESFASAEGLAKTAHGALVPASTAVEWMLHGGAAQVIGVVLNSMKAISAYSNTHRIFTEQQRLAMFGRDGGFCSFGSCDAPPGQAEAHHVTDYAQTRRTSVDDGTLACCVDHRDRIAQGWTTKMINGRPHWIPPGWLDPDQVPRRNTWNDL